MNKVGEIMGYPIFQVEEQEVRLYGVRPMIALPKNVLDVIFDKEWRDWHGCNIPIKKESELEFQKLVHRAMIKKPELLEHYNRIKESVKNCQRFEE